MVDFVPGVTQILGGSPPPKAVERLRADKKLVMSNKMSFPNPYEAMANHLYSYHQWNNDVIQGRSEKDPMELNGIGRHWVQVVGYGEHWFEI